MDPTKQPGIQIAQIIVERADFAHRDDYLGLPPSTPLGSLPLTFRYQYVVIQEKERGIVRLELKTDPSKKPLYTVNVTMVGLVRTKVGEANMPLERYVATNGAAMLFPFVRELVANLTARGRFGPVWLYPLNLTAATPHTEAQVRRMAEPRAEYAHGAKRRLKARNKRTKS